MALIQINVYGPEAASKVVKELLAVGLDEILERNGGGNLLYSGAIRFDGKKPTDKSTEKAEPRKSERQLAVEIADRLFVNGNGERAVRLVLELDGGGSGGGWNDKAAVVQIEKALKADLPQVGRAPE